MKRLVCALAWLCAADALDAQEWGRFCGPAGAGRAAEVELPLALDEQATRFRVDLLGGGHSSPVFAGELVFLTSLGESEGVRHLIALDALSGAPRWRFDDAFRGHGQHRLNSYASASPAADEERVVVAWTDAEGLEVVALDLEGELLWRTALGPFSAQHGSGVSPVLVAGRVIVANDMEGEVQSFLVALDAATGEEVWRRERETERASYATPALLAGPDGEPRLVFASTAHGLTCLDAASGELVWEHDPGLTQRCVGSPVIEAGVVFQAAGSGGGGKEMMAVRLPQEEGAAPTPAWSLERALPYVPTPVAHDGLLYLLADGGILSCVRASDGGLVYRERLGGHYFASPVILGERLYCLDSSGSLAILALGEEFERLGGREFGELSHATPAVAHGRLYVRTERSLWSFGAPDAGE